MPIEKLVNRYWQLDAENFTRLQTLAGKALAIEIAGLELKFYILVSSRGLQFCETLTRPADACIRGLPFTLASMLISEDPVAKIRQGNVEITGDMDFIQQLQHWIRHLQIDWEEQLSLYLGDTLASQLGSGLRSAKAWQQEVQQHLRQNLTEYAQEEIRHFPPREEIHDFSRDVAELRLATDRLEARLARLLHSLKDDT